MKKCVKLGVCPVVYSEDGMFLNIKSVIGLIMVKIVLDNEIEIYL